MEIMRTAYPYRPIPMQQNNAAMPNAIAADPEVLNKIRQESILAEERFTKQQDFQTSIAEAIGSIMKSVAALEKKLDELTVIPEAIEKYTEEELISTDLTPITIHGTIEDVPKKSFLGRKKGG